MAAAVAIVVQRVDFAHEEELLLSRQASMSTSDSRRSVMTLQLYNTRLRYSRPLDGAVHVFVYFSLRWQETLCKICIYRLWGVSLKTQDRIL